MSELEEGEGEWAPPPPVHPNRLAQRSRRPDGMPAEAVPPMTEDGYQNAMIGVPSLSWNSPEAEGTVWAVIRHPHRCQWISGGSRLYPEKYCEEMVEDPRVVRYCVKHALQIGYPLSIDDQHRMSDFEARHALKSLASEAVRTVREVMNDMDAPPGVRAKAAADVLDRTGLHPKSEVGIEARVVAEVIDVTEIIKQRLAEKRARLLGPDELEGGSEVVEGEVVEMHPEPVIKPPPGF